MGDKPSCVCCLDRDCQYQITRPRKKEDPHILYPDLLDRCQVGLQLPPDQSRALAA